jgi:hypothetical protein
MSHRGFRTARILGLWFCTTCICVQLQAQRYGKERWAVNTGTDSGAGAVDLASPQNTTIAQLIGLMPPNQVSEVNRFGPTEDTVFVVNATLADYKLEGGSKGDSDCHLVLQDDQGETMVARIPSPTMAPPTINMIPGGSSSTIISTSTTETAADTPALTISSTPTCITTQNSPAGPDKATASLTTTQVEATGSDSSNPLDTQYWSATPYKVGSGAVKYTAVPHSDGPSIVAPSASKDQLRVAMKIHLETRDPYFDFCVNLELIALSNPSKIRRTYGRDRFRKSPRSAYHASRLIAQRRWSLARTCHTVLGIL